VPARAWPHHELGKELSNWGRWGDDDEVGTLNFVTPGKRVQAAGLVRTGKVFDLGLPFDADGPQPPGRRRMNPVHMMTMLPADFAHMADGMMATDDMIILGLQAGTQWDSLAHVGYEGLFYNNVPAAAVGNRTGASRNSFDKVVSHLISRGVLLDIARLKDVDRLADSCEITPADLSAAEQEQGVQVEPGDVLMVRTGSIRWFGEGDRSRFMSDQPGLAVEAARWLHQRSVAAVAVDNAACEVSPSPIPDARIPFHQVAIRDMGLTIGEMFDFEALADDCAQDGVWECQFIGTGLKVTGAVGSPVTPMALK
jgi:kynurenine formamidase